MSDLEHRMIAKLTDTEEIARAHELGLQAEVFETDLYRSAFTWAINYWLNTGKTKAPTWLAMAADFPQIKPMDDVEESTEWLVEALKHPFKINVMQEIMHQALSTMEEDADATLHRLGKDVDDAIEAAGLPEPPKWDRALVAERKRWRYSDAEAKRQYDEETQGPAPPFDAGLLSEILARPEEPCYRIEDVLPSQASMVVVAQRKTGKTTLMLNLARCLTTGEKFLDRFATRPISGQVGFLNYEMDAAMLARWAATVGVPEDRLVLVNLRGRRNPLGHSDDQARLAELLRGHTVESLIVDPFGSAYTGKSQNDPGEVRAWLDDLNRWSRSEVGVFDLIVPAHMVWSGEHVRGASSVEDWGDSIVYLTSADGGRYFSALGRIDPVAEDRLDYDHDTRWMSLTGTGSRRDAATAAKTSVLIIVVIGIVTGNPGINTTQIVARARELRREGLVTVAFQDKALRDAIIEAAERGHIRREGDGKGTPFSHFPKDPVQGDSDGPPLDAVPS